MFSFNCWLRVTQAHMNPTFLTNIKPPTVSLPLINQSINIRFKYMKVIGFLSSSNLLLCHRKAFLPGRDNRSAEYISVSYKSRPTFSYPTTRGPENDQCYRTRGSYVSPNTLRSSSDPPSETNSGLN